jgi:hypothetical protein
MDHFFHLGMILLIGLDSTFVLDIQIKLVVMLISSSPAMLFSVVTNSMNSGFPFYE